MPDADLRKTVGWIGAGAIGLPMLQRLVGAGHRVVACDKAPEQLAQLQEAGIPTVGSGAEAARTADVVVLNLPDLHAVSETVFGPEGCVAGGMAGKLLIDTSSIDPVATGDLAARLAGEARGRWVDAPISGGVRAAEEGALVAFIGGADGDVADAEPLIACFADRRSHLGPVGAGQWAKLVNQAIVCGSIALWSDALALARAGGLDAPKLVEALAGSGADSRIRAAFGPGIATEDYVPSRNLAKDIAAVQLRSRESGQNSLLFENAGQILAAMRARQC